MERSLNKIGQDSNLEIYTLSMEELAAVVGGNGQLGSGQFVPPPPPTDQP